MGNETPTTCHWLTPFMDLREKMRSLVEQDLKLYHGVFLTGPADLNDLSHLVDDLEGSRLASHVQTISFPVSDDAWAYPEQLPTRRGGDRHEGRSKPVHGIAPLAEDDTGRCGQVPGAVREGRSPEAP